MRLGYHRGLLGGPGISCVCPARGPRGPTPFQHVKRKGGVDLKSATNFLTAQDDLAIRHKHTHTHTHTHTHKERQPSSRSHPTPHTIHPSAEQSDYFSRCQQSIDKSANQPISSRPIHPTLDWVETTTAARLPSPSSSRLRQGSAGLSRLSFDSTSCRPPPPDAHHASPPSRHQHSFH